MSYNTLGTIDAEHLEAARTKALAEIRKDRREAAALRIVADKLNGQYITKRIEPQLASLFPDARRVYLGKSNYSNNVDLTISYSDSNYYDRDCITICSADNRRIDRAAMIARAEENEKRARALEAALEHIEPLVNAYNATAAQYAEIHDDLYQFFDEIPYADYELERKYRASYTPEKFAEAISD